MAKAWRYKAPRRLNVGAIRQTVMEFMNQAAEEMHKDFVATQETWNHQVSFDVKVDGPSNLAGVFSVNVSTEDNQYKLVDSGAPPHVILPVNANALRFPGTFSPKTVPGVLKANPGFSGPPMKVRDVVLHPGFEARNFDETVAASFKPKFEKNAEKLMKAIRKASNNAL